MVKYLLLIPILQPLHYLLPQVVPLVFAVTLNKLTDVIVVVGV
jgi:hypothetical protein